jgi:hypothetical protein
MMVKLIELDICLKNIMLLQLKLHQVKFMYLIILNIKVNLKMTKLNLNLDYLDIQKKVMD